MEHVRGCQEVLWGKEQAAQVAVADTGGSLLSAKAVQAALAQPGTTVVDVREPDESQFERMEQSRNIPFNELRRQVQRIAGSLVLVGAFVPGFRWLSAFLGAGLVFAGATGRCGMASWLTRIPWAA